MKRDYDATLIIPTYNKASRLVPALESIKNLSFDGSLEIIFVNDGSTDNTETLLHSFATNLKEKNNFEAKVISIRNMGRSAARNIGIKNSNSKLLIFTDDDLILSKDFIKNHVEMHKDKNTVVHGQIYSLPYLKFFSDPIAGTLYTGEKASGKLSQKVINLELIKNGDFIQIDKSKKISKFEKDIQDLFTCTNRFESRFRWIGFVGGNISVCKDILNKTGLFDTNLGIEWGCEDLEMGYRLYKNKCNFIYSDKAYNYHINHYRADFETLHSKALNYFFKKHNDISIYLLNYYFSGSIQNLLKWRQEALEMMNYKNN